MVRGVADIDQGRVAFYLERALEHASPALGLGFGRGEVALALAAAGVTLEVFDPAEAVVAHAHELLRRQAPEVVGRCRVERADLRSLRLSRRFEFIWSAGDDGLALGGADDLAALLATAREHLERGGAFAFDLALETGRRNVERPVPQPPGPGAARPHLVSRAGGLQRLARFSPTIEQLDAALEASGLRVLERWSDFTGEPFQALAPRVAVVCERDAV